MIEDACSCQQDPECYWAVSGSSAACEDERYGWCPTLDIVLVVDGSGSMSMTFGRHSHGFFALTNLLREWVSAMPLSNEPSSVGLQSAPSNMARVAFIQFSGQGSNLSPTGGVVGSAQKTPPSFGTGGRLSGSLSQLKDDLAWQENNYMAQQTYMEEALYMAVGMFHDSPVDGRTRVLILITDGAVMDTSRLAKSRRELDQAQVMVFGLVIRRFEAHTPVDQKAEEMLKPIVSEPQDDHFVNLLIDEVPEQVLNTICDPQGRWGRLISMKSGSMPSGEHRPCGVYTDKFQCSTDKGCMWYESFLSCGNTPCFMHCDETSCAADVENLCVWEAAVQSCYTTVPCSHTDAALCSADPECSWTQNASLAWYCQPTPCMHTSASGCLSDPAGCVFDSLTGVCGVDECKAPSQDVCLDLPACSWETASESCTTHVCPGCGTNETCCLENQRYCQWKNSTCTYKPCAEHATEGTCIAESGCEWDSAISPGMCKQRYCSQFTPDECKLEPECVFDTEECSQLKCDHYSKGLVSEQGLERCECDANPNCFWHGGVCVDINFGGCPTLDIVIIFSGASTMAREFGNHPNGFFAVAEMMRTWLLSLPLSEEAASSPPSTLLQGVVRVGFVQFSGDKRRVVAGQLSQELSSHVPPFSEKTTTMGRISGFYSELKKDIVWHEHSFHGMDSFIAGSLRRAASMLTSNTADDGRKRMVIIIADSPLLDTQAELAAGLVELKSEPLWSVGECRSWL
eukprot:TRINITY_DN22788_c0_g1_i5.p1 TRINITY_DN22788_c0_g1~~TRINITY_DN22788_c0_g1_i5.p1  ORF type:complete len:741 (+),score=245.09 TRINITY_DN22788_c0_g1_i5:315-2537(+)